MVADALRLLGAVSDPAALLAVLVLANLIALLAARRRLTLLLQLATAAIVIVLGVLPGGSWLARPLEARFLPNPPLPSHVDGIIALGGTERMDQSEAWGQPILSDPTPIAAFIALGRRYPEAKMVFTGGGRRSSLTESMVVHNFLAELGLEGSRILYEDRSRDTRENAVFTFKRLRPSPGEQWILVAQAISLPRAVAAFREAGWNVVPFPAGYLTGRTELVASPHLRSGLDLAAIAVHEWGGLVGYRLLGYTRELFPR